jgi:hypothetical protein
VEKVGGIEGAVAVVIEHVAVKVVVAATADHDGLTSHGQRVFGAKALARQFLSISIAIHVISLPGHGQNLRMI